MSAGASTTSKGGPQVQVWSKTMPDYDQRIAHMRMAFKVWLGAPAATLNLKLEPKEHAGF